MAHRDPLVRLEAGSMVEELPARPLNVMLASMGLTQQAAKFGVERFNGRSWEPFPTHRTPLPGDHLRIKSPPSRRGKYLQHLIGLVTKLMLRNGWNR